MSKADPLSKESPKEFLTGGHVCAMAQIPLGALQWVLRRGELTPVAKVNGQRLYDPEDVRRFVQRLNAKRKGR